jgi:hypothetical protein
MSLGGASSCSSSTSSTDRNASVFVAGADHRATTTWSLEPGQTPEVTMVDEEVVLAERGIQQLREGSNRKSDEDMKIYAMECNVYEYFSFKCKNGG